MLFCNLDCFVTSLKPDIKQDRDRIRLNSVSLRFRNLKEAFHFQVG